MKSFFLLLLTLGELLAADYKAGVGRIDITPEGPIWMSGYASRNKPSEGVIHPLWAKALALEDTRGGKVVIITSDLVGLPRSITDVVGARVEKEYSLERSRILINSSHTHTGPLIAGNLALMADLDDVQDRAVRAYSRKLTDQLVAVIGSALSSMKPATIALGLGTADFAANRRERTATGIKLGVNPGGPVDRSVPVLRVSDDAGKLLAILFGYACHNTTLTGSFYQISGDYAGVAQAELERSHAGATAMFLQLCGGDQNPHPRSDLTYVEQHGRSLAAEVDRVLGGKLERVRGRVNASMQWKDLPLQPHSRDDFEKLLSSSDAGKVRFAKAMLQSYDQRRAVRSVPWPVQTLRLGDRMGIVALGGEPVVEYALRIKAAHPKLRLIVAGYSNDVMGYVPTAKMLEEGGYEPVASTIPYGLAAPFAPEMEMMVLRSADDAIARVFR